MEAAHRGPSCEKIVICNMCIDDWNIYHRWGQKRCPPKGWPTFKKKKDFHLKLFEKILWRKSEVIVSVVLNLTGWKESCMGENWIKYLIHFCKQAMMSLQRMAENGLW